METSNSTVTGSDTFSTGRMNWLYLLNNLRNNLSSPFDEQHPNETKKKKKWKNSLTLKCMAVFSNIRHIPQVSTGTYITQINYY